MLRIYTRYEVGLNAMGGSARNELVYTTLLITASIKWLILHTMSAKNSPLLEHSENVPRRVGVRSGVYDFA